MARILGWVALPFSRGSSWPRVWTQISCIAGRFFTIWATREAWWMGLMPLEWDNRELSHLHHHVRPSEKSTNAEEGPQLTILAPGSQTSNLQNCEQQIFVVYELPSLLNRLNRLRQISSVVRMRSFWNSLYSIGRNAKWCIQPLWKNSLGTFYIQQSYFRYLPKRNKNICPPKTSMPMFTTALFIIVRNNSSILQLIYKWCISIQWNTTKHKKESTADVCNNMSDSQKSVC